MMRSPGRKKRVHSFRRIDPQAVGSHKRKISPDRQIRHFLLQVPAPGFGESAGNDHRPFDAFFNALGYHIRHKPGPHRDNSQIHGNVNLSHGPVHRFPVQGSAFGIHGKGLYRIPKVILVVNHIGGMMVMGG